MRHVVLGISLACALVTASPPAAAADPEPTPKRDERVRLTDDFAPWELGVVGAVVAWDIAVYAAGGAIAKAVIGGANDTPCQACRIGAPSATDRAVSEELWKLGSPGRKWLGGI